VTLYPVLYPAWVTREHPLSVMRLKELSNPFKSGTHYMDSYLIRIYQRDKDNPEALWELSKK
jgi:hypothetical protein